VSLDVWQFLFMLTAAAMAARGVGRERPGWIAWAGVPLGLGLLCKPFMALLAVPLLGVWMVWIGRSRWLGWLGIMTAAAVAVAAPWHLSMYALYGRAFVDEYLGHEVVRRAMGEVLPGHKEPTPPWFYLEMLGVRYWPWLLPAGAGVYGIVRGRTPGRDPRLARLGLVWSVGWLVALSAFPDRRDRYDVPIFLGTSVIAGAWLASAWAGAGRRWLRGSVRLAPAALPLLGVVTALAPIRVYPEGNGQWERLGAWAGENHPQEFWNGGAGFAQCGETYLVTGVWPRSATQAARPGPGALILYHATGGLGPGVGETVLFQHADVTVTVLGAAPWSPGATKRARAEEP
jgi:4-amino-4-deoxy-L-arabinose transferase-like glycosyltransferase